MQAALRRSLWSASRNPARFVAGRRHPPRSTRNFHSFLHRALSFPFPTPAPHNDETAEHNEPQASQSHDERNGAPSVVTDGGRALEVAENDREVEIVAENGNGNGNGNGDKDRTNYGSGLRRSMRNKRPKDIPPWDVPDWFFTRNVKIHKYDSPLTSGGLDYGSSEATNGEDSNVITRDEVPQSSKGISQSTSPIGNPTSKTNVLHGESLEEHISSLRDVLRKGVKIDGGQRQMPEQTQTILTSIRETILVARRDRAVDSIVESAERVVGESCPELLDYKSASNLSSQTTFDRDISMSPDHEKPFQISWTFMNELLTLCAASFSTLQSSKANLKLLCPIDGAIYLLDRIVDQAASQLEADVIRLDSQDFAQIVGDYISESADTVPDGLWNLGFDTGPFTNRSNEKMAEEEDEAEEDAEDEAEEFTGGRSTPFGKFSTMTSVPIIGIGAGGSIADFLKKLPGQLGAFPTAGQNLKPVPRSNGTDVSPFAQVRNPGQEWNDMKTSALLEFLLDANNVKDRNDTIRANLLTARIYRSLERSVNLELTKENPSSEQQLGLIATKELMSHKMQAYSQGPAFENGRRTIVYLRGYGELRDTQRGNQILNKITELVRKKRKEGQEIMIVGASCAVGMAPRLSGEAIEALQADSTEPYFRSLVVAPKVSETETERQRLDLQLDDHAEHHLFSLNARHLHNMILRMQGHSNDVYARDWSTFAEQLLAKSPCQLTTELKQRLWSVDEVQRVVFTAIGTRSRLGHWQSNNAGLEAKDIASAGILMLKSDSMKSDWAEEEQIRRDNFTKSRPGTKRDDRTAQPMPKKMSKREQRLMRGVVNADKLHTTFKDVHAPEDTIEALKTLTTLSLKRPDAFKYGVLATDKISGCLLYGPPGTGKTMLAKAVAKDTGATMLEVSGSDLYDMYVGEGEKNVAAVFSLAKKLAPCVVFIDEADAIFASRGSGGERKSHREMINQFLKEWDGMNETTAFIMVATNRPFDLDEAALRRLPRRILVDLPSEKDREAILGIHLKGEQVDEAVSISSLASQSPLYSGSDLKNVVVAAALAAVREENDQAAKYVGEEPYKYPEKRVLLQRHFDRAMAEISASISEDMDSLGAIKKFDEKYGDRRGRRKKTVYGFTGAEVKEDTAKVRT